MSSIHLQTMLLSMQKFQNSNIAITINDYNHEPLFLVSLYDRLFQVINLHNNNIDYHKSVDSVIQHIENHYYII